MIIVCLNLLFRRGLLIYQYATCADVSGTIFENFLWLHDLVIPTLTSSGLLIFSLALYSLFSKMGVELKRLGRVETKRLQNGRRNGSR